MAGIKVKGFFNGRFFEIPKYQRGFAWEKQNVRDLFDDIIESIDSKTNHYIGTIVLSKTKEDDKYFVVDGQQRITTLSIIISLLVKELSQENHSYYSRFYIKEDDKYRLTLLNRDKVYYFNLIDGFMLEPTNKSQRFLRSAYEEISCRLPFIGDKLNFLKALEKLELMEFVEESEGDAIRIFQTVNDRGKLLSNMEKAKSLLIYFSNRYLEKKLDDSINNSFSEIFENYDDIKHYSEVYGISLISNIEFNEDNLMRYHFVTYSNENYEPSAAFVLQYLKRELSLIRNKVENNDYSEIESFITNYVNSLNVFFKNCKEIIEKVGTDTNYYKLFSILNLSATLYPLVIQLYNLKLLDRNLTGESRKNSTFFDLVEIIEVRVYKTRGTDPKADISRFVYEIANKSSEEIEKWLIWFNQRWMSKEEFFINLNSSIYGNRALQDIFVNYNEEANKSQYTLDELKQIVNSKPTIEHILSQTPDFSHEALGFETIEDYLDNEHKLGNLTLLEKKLNSAAQNKNPLEKVSIYDRSFFSSTRKLGTDIYSNSAFTKQNIVERVKELSDYCVSRWWCD